MAQALAATTWNREICFVGHQTGRGLRLASARALTTPVLLSPAGGGRDIEDENDMQLVVLIARGVLDRICQDQQLVFFPIPVLELDPVGAFFRQDQRQLGGQPGVGLSGVAGSASVVPVPKAWR